MRWGNEVQTLIFKIFMTIFPIQSFENTLKHFIVVWAGQIFIMWNLYHIIYIWFFVLIWCVITFYVRTKFVIIEIFELNWNFYKISILLFMKKFCKRWLQLLLLLSLLYFVTHRMIIIYPLSATVLLKIVQISALRGYLITNLPHDAMVALQG